MMGWRVQLLGVPVAVSPEGKGLRLERRAAALLAYLALEGRSAKFALASLLWPDPEPPTVRNNMRHLLRRMRVATGGQPLAEGAGQQLELPSAVSVDAARLKASAQVRDHTGVLAASGGGIRELLAGLSFDDCPEFARWLDGARASVSGWYRHALGSELQRLERDGGWDAALLLALEWVRDEPESEEASRHLIRLHYLRGERSAALSAFERLREALSRELGVEPSEELCRMRDALDRAAVPATTPSGMRAVLPLSVQRPPVLAGREATWRELEEAWERGVPLLFIGGEPGVGKSRLAEEFAERKGRWLRAEGRVGEREVPYAAHTRVLRTLRAQRPDVTLEEWVRRELLRLLPELGAPGELPGPLHDERDLLRFYEANFEAMVALHSRLDTVVVDDLQYWDDASSRLFTWVLARLRDGEGRRLPRFIDCYRRGELTPYVDRVADELVSEGLARRFELGPLDEEDVRRLVAASGVDGAEAHAGEIARFTGGNPLFVVETLKHLLETGALAGGWPERLPPPGKVVLLIARRLERLSPEALQLARVAALGRTQFSLSLAARVLQRPMVAVGQAAAELEAALLMVEERFTHDLVHEAVEAGIPAALGRALHQAIAEELAQREAPAVLQAHHWLEAGVPGRGLALLLTAASAEEDALLSGEAAALYARAAGLLEGAGQLGEAQALREREARCRRVLQRRN